MGFSKLRLFIDRNDSCEEAADSLYVLQDTSLERLVRLSSAPSYLCICTTSYESIAATMAHLPKTTSWIAVESDSLSQIVNDLLDWADLLIRWEQRCSLTVAHGGSLHELLEESSDAVGLPVAVCGPLYSDYVHTQKLRAADPFFEEIERNGSLSADSVRKLEDLQVFGTAPQDRNVKLFEPNEHIQCWHMNRHFRSNGRRVFFATAWCPDGKPDPGAVELFDMLAQFAYQLYQANQLEKSGTFSQQSQALYELLCGEQPTQELVSDMFLKLGVSSDGVWQLAVVKLSESDSITKAYHASRFRKHTERALTCVIGNEIVALLPVDQSTDEALAELKLFAEQQGARLGVSSRINDLSEVQTAHKQALFAIRMGSRVSEKRVLQRKLGIDKEYPSTLFYFDDYLFHELLDHYPLGAVGINPGKRPIDDLVEYDRENDTQKARFLYTYMACNGVTGETARRMGIHRNSVGYQIRSIESILGVDVHDLDFLCHARMAFASMEVFGQ